MAMTRKEITESIALAEEFITAGKQLFVRIDYEKSGYGYGEPKMPEPHDKSWSSPQSGTLRRKSMDLTRKLAALRKSEYQS
jgi:hypothetical protein